MDFVKVWVLVSAALCCCFLNTVTSSVPECSIVEKIEQDREECLNRSNSENQTFACKRIWDNVSCWEPADVGVVVVMPCPDFITLLSGTQGNVSRNCTSEGWTDMYPPNYFIACEYYPNSSDTEEKVLYDSMKIGYTVGHSLSLISLTVAMIILCLFRKLHCTRNYIHMHLFMSFIMRAIAVFIKDVVLYERGESDHCSTGSAGCKVAMVFFQYCIMANFFWLLVEGLYLHTLLVISFFSERKYFWWYILIGWGAPSVFTTAWAITKHYNEDVSCWDIILSDYWWIIKTPILVSIMVNFVLFICIIRILVQKLHSPDVGRSESSHYSRLAKSTLLLIPLFGVHYIIFAFFPDNFKVLHVKLIFELVLGSFQGFVVAVLYCFLNGEVQAELKRKWRRWHLERFLGSDMKYHHPSQGSNGTNFSTQISMLAKCSPKTRRSSTCPGDSSSV